MRRYSRKNKSKFNAKKTKIDGITFDSKKEGERYKELKLLEKANEISDLKIQPRYLLQKGFSLNGKRYRPIHYVADFEYVDNRTGERVVEDVKGYKTQVYNLKKKLFTYKYQTEILET